MGRRENILDGLAWAGMSEDARVAKIAAMLVRQCRSGYRGHTKSHVRETIRDTSPPYGRGKAIFEKVWGTDKDGETGEMARQQEIYDRRQKAQRDWKNWQSHQRELSTRLNNAYAAAFDRPPYEPSRECPFKWTYSMGYDHPIRAKQEEWQEQEHERDKGDTCLAITHQDGFVVALVSTVDKQSRPHIATRYKDGPITRTYLRGTTKNLVEAAVLLGGPHVRAAIAKGKRVKTDWVGRRTFVHHDGSDHIDPKIEELPWRAAIWESRTEKTAHWERTIDTRVEVEVHGDDVTKSWRSSDEDEYYV